MTMLEPNVAGYAKVVVIADETCHKIGLIEDYILSANSYVGGWTELTSNARIASTAHIE